MNKPICEHKRYVAYHGTDWECANCGFLKSTIEASTPTTSTEWEKWQDNLETLSFTYLERNPENKNEFRRTYWSGADAKSRMNSLIGSLLLSEREKGREEADWYGEKLESAYKSGSEKGYSQGYDDGKRAAS